MDIYLNIITLQEYFYRKVTGKSEYEFDPSDRDLQILSSFMYLLKEYHNGDVSSIGIHYLYNYFLFQYTNRSTQDTRFGKTIMLNWILGQKAFNKWLERKETVTFYEHEFCKKFNVSEEDYRSHYHSQQSYDCVSLNEVEEIEKRRAFNSLPGFSLCIESTTMYNHRSKWCLTCKFKTDCKKLLKLNYPHIYKDRGYWAQDIKKWKNAIESGKL